MTTAVQVTPSSRRLMLRDVDFWETMQQRGIDLE